MTDVRRQRTEVRRQIEKLNLSKHPEWGYYRQTYKSDFIVRPRKESYMRSSATHIYYFLSRGMYSKFHKVKHDEIWNLFIIERGIHGISKKDFGRWDYIW
jgi:predicted cupin superfamily sugar epimerase